jgi:phosphoribosyl-ATP pyrophosphohydrolase
MKNLDVIERLFDVIKSRKKGDPQTSYVAKLYDRGLNKIAQKVGEEAVETVIAAASKDRNAVIDESVDLLFHLMILWAQMDLDLKDIVDELQRREGTSGIYEKKNRPA